MAQQYYISRINCSANTNLASYCHSTSTRSARFVTTPRSCVAFPRPDQILQRLKQMAIQNIDWDMVIDDWYLRIKIIIFQTLNIFEMLCFSLVLTIHHSEQLFILSEKKSHQSKVAPLMTKIGFNLDSSQTKFKGCLKFAWSEKVFISVCLK